MGGLAVAIGLAMILMVTMPVVVLVLLAKRFGAVPMVVALALGVVVGLLAVTATFFESTWSPPVRVVFEGQSDEKVIVLVADEKAPPIVITGAKLPFVERRVVFTVPPDAVVRVQQLAPLQGDLVNGTWAGRDATGFGSVAEGMVFDFHETPEWIDYGALIRERLAR